MTVSSTRRALRTLLAVLFLAAGAATAAAAHAQDDGKARVLGNGVARWQLQHMADFDYVTRFRDETVDPRGWVQGVFYLGLQSWAETTGDAQFQDAVVAWAKKNAWKLGNRIFHADDHTVGQTYLRLNQIGHAGDEALAYAKANFEAILQSRPTVSLEFAPIFTSAPHMRLCQLRWCWADALFMSPPVWFALSNLTGNPRFRDYANAEFWATTDLLFSKEHGLYFRDSRFIDRPGDYGEAVFWSRGNGWVFASLTNLLALMPPDFPDRARYETLFKTMARAVVAAQRSDGFWSASLLAPEAKLGPETSGTAFFVAGLLRGLEAGLLAEEDVATAIDRGWAALTSAILEDGRLGYVQQIGDAPNGVAKNSTQLYGSGAFLLAASAMLERAASNSSTAQ